MTKGGLAERELEGKIRVSPRTKKVHVYATLSLLISINNKITQTTNNCRLSGSIQE